MKHGIECATVRFCFISVPGLGGEADAGVGVCCVPWAPGPQVHCLLEAHLDLGARVWLSQGFPWSAPHPAPSIQCPAPST